MPGNEKKSGFLTSQSNPLLLPPTERMGQLQKVLQSPDWPTELSKAFPDVINEREIEQELEILDNIAEAQANRRKWQKREKIIGIGGGIGGLLLTGILTRDAGVAMIVGVIAGGGGSFYANFRADEEKWKAKADILRWEGLKGHWWERNR